MKNKKTTEISGVTTGIGAWAGVNPSFSNEVQIGCNRLENQILSLPEGKAKTQGLTKIQQLRDYFVSLGQEFFPMGVYGAGKAAPVAEVNA